MQDAFKRQKPEGERHQHAMLKQNDQKDQTPDQLGRAGPGKQTDNLATMFTCKIKPQARDYIGAAIGQKRVDTSGNDRDEHRDAKDRNGYARSGILVIGGRGE